MGLEAKWSQEREEGRVGEAPIANTVYFHFFPEHVVPESRGCELSIMPPCQHAIIYFRAFKDVNYFSFCPSTTIGDSD